MKYFVWFAIMVLLAIPLRQARAQPSFANNYFTNSYVNQFILVNCRIDECLPFIQKYIFNENDLSGEEIAALSQNVIEGNIISAPPAPIIESDLGSKLIAPANSTTVEINSLIIAPAEANAMAVPAGNMIESPDMLADANATVAGQIAPADANATVVVQNMPADTNATAPSTLNVPTLTVLPTLNFTERSVRINEIMAVPVSPEKEWVELFNATDQPIDLTDWSLGEGAGQKTKLFGVIEPMGYLVFDKSSLNNDGDLVALKDPSGAVIDQVSYGTWDDGNMSDNAPTMGKNNTIILWQNEYHETIMPTKGAENIFEPVPMAALAVSGTASAQTVAVQLPVENVQDEQAGQNKQKTLLYQFSDKIFINEFLPNPAGSDDNEWIELYNAGDIDVELTGWSLNDNGGSPIYKIKDGTVIKAKNFMVLGREETKIALNNTSDQIALFDPNNQLVAQFAYDKTEENASWARFASAWEQTKILTPGEENEKSDLQMSALAVKPSVEIKAGAQTSYLYFPSTFSLADIKNLPLRSKVSVVGQVNVLPSVFSKNTIHLVNGLQIYFSKADWPALRTGDVIEISGVTSESQGTTRMLLKDKKDLKILRNEPLPEPLVIDSSEMNDDLDGAFIRIIGELSQKTRGKLTFSDDLGEFYVGLKTGSHIDAGLMALNEKIQITGIISNVNGQYLILPRQQDDLQNLTLLAKPVVGQIAKSNDVVVNRNKNFKIAVWALSGLLSLLALANLYFVWRKKNDIIQFVKGQKWKILLDKINFHKKRAI